MEKEAIHKPKRAFLRKHTGAPEKLQQLQQLPEEVIEEILSRLAVKPLLRFRSVSKRWNTLISSSRRFASMHLKRSLSNPTMHSIIFIRRFFEDGRFPLVYLNPIDLAPLAPSSSHHLDPYHPVVNPIDPPKLAREIVGSINGLVCIRSIPRYETDWLGIWNPSTKTVRELSIPACTEKPDFYAVAFGWDPIANDHKVMRLCRTRYSSCGWVEVWSVAGGSRRSFRIDGLGDVLPICTQSLIMGDGRTYCLVSRGETNGLGIISRKRDLIACFDVVKEEIRFISLPVDTNNCDGNLVALVNWKGELALSSLIEKPGFNTPPSFQIWKAAADMEGWTKSFIIDLSSDDDDVPPCVYNPATSITPTQILILGYGQIFLYDLETKQYIFVEVPNLKKLQAFHHVESLF